MLDVYSQSFAKSGLDLHDFWLFGESYTTQVEILAPGDRCSNGNNHLLLLLCGAQQSFHVRKSAVPRDVSPWGCTCWSRIVLGAHHAMYAPENVQH